MTARRQSARTHSAAYRTQIIRRFVPVFRKCQIAGESPLSQNRIIYDTSPPQSSFACNIRHFGHLLPPASPSPRSPHRCSLPRPFQCRQAPVPISALAQCLCCCSPSHSTQECYSASLVCESSPASLKPSTFAALAAGQIAPLRTVHRSGYNET